MKLKRVIELTEKDEKREREFVMMCLAVTCGCGTLAEALRLVLAVMDWHEGTLTDGWVLAMRSVNLVVCAVCAWLTFLIIREIKQRRVFTRQNAQYISLIGSAATFGGIAQNVVVNLVYGDTTNHSGDMTYLVLGLLLLFINSMVSLAFTFPEAETVYHTRSKPEYVSPA